MSYLAKTLSIKTWAEEDRPREKLLTKGSRTLSKAELIAIILGSGSRNQSAVDLAKEILLFYDNDLDLLAKASVAELKKFKGIGEAKAIALVSTLELGRRRLSVTKKEQTKISSSNDAYEYLMPSMFDLKHEVFKILLLNRQNKIIKIQELSSGGVTGTVVDPKMIFKEALDYLACGIILCHNHPSGNLKPSQSDIDLTNKIKSAGSLFDINVLDHLIISSEGYFSFADEGMI